MNPVRRLREVVHRRGARDTAKLVAQRLSPRTDWSNEYVWSRLDLAGDRPRRTLPEHMTLRRGGLEDLPLVETLPTDASVTTMSAELVERRLNGTGQLWLVVAGDRAAFCCWNFLGEGPLAGARNDTIGLPEGVVLLEDSLASPHFRGQGVAPGAWSGIADAQAEAGNAALVTKVHVDNAPSRRAVQKAGFVEFATMRLSGPLYRPRVSVSFIDPAPAHAWLAAIER